MTVVQDRQSWDDGSSHVSIGGHLEKIWQRGVGGVGTDPMTIHRGYDGPS